MPATPHHEEEIRAAFRRLHHAIRTKDRAGLEALHDPEFQGAELPGNLITAEEHVLTAMNGEDLELEVFDLEVELHGDIALARAKQTLRGGLVPDDPGTSPTMAAEVEDGIWFRFLVVWRFTDGRWRMLSYQCEQIHDPELQGGTPFDDSLSETEAAEPVGEKAAKLPATAAPRGTAAAAAEAEAALGGHLDDLVGTDRDAVETRVYGDLALTWGRAAGETPRSFLGVWAQGPGGPRLLGFQSTELPAASER